MNWIKAEINKSLLTGEVKRGKGIYEKAYFVVKIPCGYGYDDYCFYHSKSLISTEIHISDTLENIKLNIKRKERRQWNNPQLILFLIFYLMPQSHLF